MSDEFVLVTNPSKLAPHYDMTIKATYSGNNRKIIINNNPAPHVKIGVRYNGIKYTDEIVVVEDGSTVQFVVDIEDGYNVEFVYINNTKYYTNILESDFTIKYDTEIHVSEIKKQYYANFEAIKNTELTVHYVLDGEPHLIKLVNGQTESILLPFGTEIDVSYLGYTGYICSLTKSGIKTEDTSFTVTENLWLATSVEKMKYIVTLKYPDNAMLEVWYIDDFGEEHRYHTGSIGDQSTITDYFKIPYGTPLHILVSVSIGTSIKYIRVNDIEVSNDSDYTVTGDVYIETLAQIKQNIIIIKKSDLCNNLVIYNGKTYDYTTSFNVRDGDYIYFNITPKNSFTHYVKSIVLNDVEYSGLKSFQIYENTTVDSVAGVNIFPESTIKIFEIEHGKLKVFYIDKEYTAKDSPFNVLQQYNILIWLEPDEGYKPSRITVNGNEINPNTKVAYKVLTDLIINGWTVEI